MKRDRAPLDDAARRRFQERLSRFIYRADYRGALTLAAEHLRRHPDDFDAAHHYASVLGDRAESLPAAARGRMRARSVALMRQLLRRPRAAPSQGVLFALRNEYFWQTGNRAAQYALGVAEARSGDRRGNYSQGVGAAWRALELAQRGRRGRAEVWARRAVAAWGRYRRFRPRYYNQFVHLALAYGVLGRRADMERALARGSRLSGKPAGYREFAEVRRLVDRLRPA